MEASPTKADRKTFLEIEDRTFYSSSVDTNFTSTGQCKTDQETEMFRILTMEERSKNE